MIRPLTRIAAIFAIAVGASLVAVPALAYTDTSPGSGGSVSSSTVQPGQPFTFTATFTDLPSGTNVGFSAASSAGCTGTTFNPGSAALDTNHQASTSVTVPGSCAGQSVTLAATGPAGQQVFATVAVAGGFPNTVAATTSSVPFGWLVIAFGLILLAAGTFGLTRRSATTEARA